MWSPASCGQLVAVHVHMYAKVCWKMGTWPGTEYLGTMVVEARMARCFCHLDGMIICAFEASTMVHLLRFATEIAQGSESRAKKPQTCQVDVEANQIHKSTNPQTRPGRSHCKPLQEPPQYPANTAAMLLPFCWCSRLHAAASASCHWIGARRCRIFGRT